MKVKIYGMPSCPDCVAVEAQVVGNADYEVINIGESVQRLKEFLRYRDSLPLFDDAKKYGGVGIPCFVREDGFVTLNSEEVGLNAGQGASCNIDGTGC